MSEYQVSYETEVVLSPDYPCAITSNIGLTEHRTLSNCTTDTMRNPKKIGRQQLCVGLRFRP